MSYQINNPKDEFIMSTMEELVPKDHLVRKIIRHVRFDFIRELTKPYYSELGRPGYDPVILFKIAILKSLFGIPSIRRTCEEIKVNIAYRYFLGIPFSENTPDHSTYSKAYTTRFYETDVYEKVFENILEQVIEAKLVDTTYVFMDSTHVKASANKRQYVSTYVKAEKSIFEAEMLTYINEVREENDEKPLPPKKGDTKEKKKKESKTDPDSGWLSKGEKEHTFAYNAHTVCDHHGFILKQMTKPSNVHDSQMFTPLFEHITERFESIEAMGLDAGYKTGPIIKRIADEHILPLLPYKRTNEKKGTFGNGGFIYDEEENSYTCPHYETLTYQKTTRQGYKEYHSDEDTCKSCPLKKTCLSAKATYKVLRVSIYKPYFEFAEEIRHSDYGKEKYALRKETIERDFGDFKERHGGRYTHYRGLKKVSDHISLAFSCMNMKKMALRLSEFESKETSISLIKQFFSRIFQKIDIKKPILKFSHTLKFQN
ncbi:MAG: IS1182 family transposase [Candidatus Izemoplasmatales bacterium]|jgi:transposase|nr:IS1182 family transposase [Candidatus Izemoplasmatales bacterium]